MRVDPCPLSREEAQEIVTLPSDEKAITALRNTNREKKGQPSKETYFESYDLQDGELVFKARYPRLRSVTRRPEDEHRYGP